MLTDGSPTKTWNRSTMYWDFCSEAWGMLFRWYLVAVTFYIQAARVCHLGRLTLWSSLPDFKDNTEKWIKYVFSGKSTDEFIVIGAPGGLINSQSSLVKLALDRLWHIVYRPCSHKSLQGKGLTFPVLKCPPILYQFLSVSVKMFIAAWSSC